MQGRGNQDVSRKQCGRNMWSREQCTGEKSKEILSKGLTLWPSPTNEPRISQISERNFLTTELQALDRNEPLSTSLTEITVSFFSECGCPKGNPTADPPIFAQKCDAEGECYCESDMNRVKNGCESKTSVHIIIFSRYKLTSKRLSVCHFSRLEHEDNPI